MINSRPRPGSAMYLRVKLDATFSSDSARSSGIFDWIATNSLQSSHLDLRILRQSAREENGAGVSTAALTYQEDYILAALQLTGDATEIVIAVHRLLVDL